MTEKTETTGRRGIRRTTRQEAFTVWKMMEPVLTKDEATGFWSYADGWSDQRIAKETDVGLGMVSYLRQEHFGKLRECRVRKENPIKPLQKQLDKLAASNAALDREVSKLNVVLQTVVDRLSKLEGELGVTPEARANGAHPERSLL